MCKREKEQLDRYYDVIPKEYNLSQDNPWNIFMHIKDYIEYIFKTPILKEITEEIEMRDKNLLKEELRLERIAQAELKKSEKKVLDIVKKNNLQNQAVRKYINELKKFREGKIGIGPSRKPSEYIEMCLFDICRSVNLSKWKHKTVEEVCKRREKLFKEFVEESPGVKNIYGNFSFSKTIKKRRMITMQIERFYETDTLGDWRVLKYLPYAFNNQNAEEFFSNCKKSKASLYLNLVLGINEYSSSGQLNRLGREDLVSGFIDTLKRIHVFLIEKLVGKELEEKNTISKNKNKKKEQNIEYYINSQTGHLHIGTKIIEFVRKKTKQYRALKAIINHNKNNELLYNDLEEIMDKMKTNGGAYNNKQIEGYVTAINNKIEKVGIKDFFENRSANEIIKINNKYKLRT